MQAARKDDRTNGICSHPSHKSPITTGGSIIEGSTTYIIDNKGAARKGDKVKSDCGHFGTINTCSSTTFADSKGVARVNDSFAGDYTGTITAGSPTTNID